MAMQAEDPVPSPTAQLVGNAFVEQYYNMLSKSPDVVHKFYQDSSVMSRPVADGSVSSVSTMTGINQMILSLDYKDCEVQILTADSQKSFGDGVIVLVTGFLTAKDGLKRKFTQVFFLAPQDTSGFFVLNDLLRYVDEEELPLVKGSEVAADSAPVVNTDPEPTPFTNHAVVEQDTATVTAEDTIQANNEASLPLGNGDIAEKDDISNHVVEAAETDAGILEAEVTTQEEQHHRQLSEATATLNALEDAPKKSYASIANQLNFKPQPFQQRIAPQKPVVHASVAAAAPVAAPADAPAPRPPRNNSVERNNNLTGKGHPIFVANLPMDATPEQLYEIFQKFGPIKPGGVQVRSYKQEKNCFGFVDFESPSSMEKALQVATIVIGNREAHIEKKKAAGEGRKFLPGRGGFRNDGFRDRGGSFVGGRGGGGYGKGEFENQQGGGNFTGQARGGGGGRNGEVKAAYQNGGGRGPRQTRPVQPPPAAAAPTSAAPAAAAAVVV